MRLINRHIYPTLKRFQQRYLIFLAYFGFRKTLYEALRGFQSLFGEARERTFKAISFAKLLRKDLEVAAEFNLTGGFDELMIRLQQTEHVQVMMLLKLARVFIK